jgi:hypothetical protein
MNLRRAGLAVLAAVALTVTAPAGTAYAAPAPTRAEFRIPASVAPVAAVAAVAAVVLAPAAHGIPAAVAALRAAGALVPADLAGSRRVRPWPLPVPDIAGLLPGLFAVNAGSLECLTAPGGTGPATQRPCRLDDAYRWKLVPVSLDGRFKVENAATGHCLVPAGAVHLAAGRCGDDRAGTWRLRNAPGVGAYVVNAASERCLTVERDGSAVQYRCDGDVSRRWSFRLRPGGAGVVTVDGGGPNAAPRTAAASPR